MSVGSNTNNSAFNKAIDEKLFRLLIARVEGYAIYMIDPNGYIMSWNQGAENIKGYTADEIIGQHISVFYTPEDIQKGEPRNNLHEALKNGVSEFEGWRVRKDGSRFWANVVLTTLYDDNGHLIGFAKITRDITSRKKSEEENEAAKAKLEKKVKENTEKIIAGELKFSKLIANSYDGITLLNHNLDIFYRTSSAERITGWSDKERVSLAINDLVHPDDKPLVDAAFAEVLKNPGVPIVSTYRIKHHQGHYIWTECIYNNMLNDPNINAIVCNFRDVTRRIEAEKEIHHLNENLERKVIERTLQLEAANKELESFSYSVSHDLRTPLRAVNGYAMMLKEDFEAVLGPEGNRLVDTIKNNAKLMGQLIDDLLTFSRLGRKELSVYKVDMHQLAQTCVNELLEHEPLEYKIAIHATLPPCNADGSMIKQVWMNLISNAIKYSSKSPDPAIEIGFLQEKGAYSDVYFVKDNGVGFDMQYADKLFGVFQRLHRSDEFSGTGVGLALVKRIIDRHGGHLWADAAVGKGAEFYFTLPRN